MTFTMFDSHRWTADDEQRARSGLAARAELPDGPRTGDIIIHPDQQCSRLWITEYSGEPYACGEDPDYGFILNTDGTVYYTGTSGMRANTRIDLANLTSGSTTNAAMFWIDRMDEQLPGDVLTLTTEVRVWHLTDSDTAAAVATKS